MTLLEKVIKIQRQYDNGIITLDECFDFILQAVIVSELEKVA